MFNELRQFATLMRQLPKMKEEMEKLQTRLGQITAEGDAGAGWVRARVNGRMELVACEISEDAVKTGDREMLEELIKAAVNQALTRVRQQAAEETSRLASGLGVLPPGMNLPGLT